MDFITIFDLGVAALVLILGIKGVINGLIKEVFGLVGLIGGIVVASRFAKEAGELVSEKVYKLDGDSVLFFMGFLVLLIGFWLACLAIGAFLSKMVGLSGLGFLDKIGGFIIGSAKIFLAFSVLFAIISNMQTINSKIEPYFQGSKLYPILLSSGKWIMNLDVNGIKNGVGDLRVPFENGERNESDKTQTELNSTIL
jgi:colicin V production protein